VPRKRVKCDTTQARPPKQQPRAYQTHRSHGSGGGPPSPSIRLQLNLSRRSTVAFITKILLTKHAQLGGTGADEDGHYVLGDDALACLKDLKRWLKLYDEKLNRLDVARCLAEGNLVNGDLLEILAVWSEESMENRMKMKIALACCNLGQPSETRDWTDSAKWNSWSP
jgi:hypothetical protein